MSSLPSVNAIVFDLHGEYTPLAGDGVRRFKVAGVSDVESKHTISDGVIYLPYWLLSYEALVSMFVDRSDQNAPNQAMIMAREINEAKKKYLEKNDLKDIADCFTIDSPVPFDLSLLVDRLKDINAEMVPGARAGSEKQGDFHGKLSRLISRLENKISDRRLGFMFNGGGDLLKVGWLDEFSKYVMGSANENCGKGVNLTVSIKQSPATRTAR